MKRTTRTWSLLSLTLFVAAVFFWQLGRRYASKEGANEQTNSAPSTVLNTNVSAQFGKQLLTAQTLNRYLSSTPGTQTASAAPLSPANLRLRNTAKPLGQLTRSETAILLKNAFIETSDPAAVAVPDHLRSDGDPGSYVVQSRGLLDDRFRAELRDAGATIISYIPNNAYLVRMSAAGAQQLAARPRTQAILPFEPYFKLDDRLLALAVEQQPLPEDGQLRVTLFPDDGEAGIKAIRALNAEIIGEDRSPFGPQVIIQPRPDSLVALSRLTSVQGIETQAQRVPLNDRTRVRLGVSTLTTGTTNDYLGLTGAGVLVNVNDTGVDATHPDLSGRVTGLSTDLDGHGTHVAGVIAGNGARSSTVTNVPGSAPGANFRGMAPNARLYVLPADPATGPLISDSDIQETAATNSLGTQPGKTLISNNGWGYSGVHDYNSSAASYDAAVRDALPGLTGSQPAIYVFAAGNDGFGFDNGQGGVPNSLVSPATAKNVISVGALENSRGLTNFVTVTNVVDDGTGVLSTNVATNQFFFAATDSDNEVASFSSRGNVGIALEGDFGRFKPDVVAPGSFVISTRAKGWADPVSFTNVQVNTLTDEEAQAGQFGPTHLIDVPPEGSQLIIRVLPNGRSASPFPNLVILADFGVVPDTNSVTPIGTNQIVIPGNNFPLPPGPYYFRVFNPGAQPAFYDIQTLLTITNASPGYFEALKTVNDTLKPSYRFESGTSMSGAAVSGLLAMMEELFTKRGETPSPALLKALLINGARSAGPLYDYQVQTLVNSQGWGVVNITNSIPAFYNVPKGGAAAGSTVPHFFADQSLTNALATGESRSWNVVISTNAQQELLRVTLVWTDPPGNPNASVKLVNDLDLIVKNLDSGEILYGNNIPVGSDFTQAILGETSPVNDVINNVENVFLNRPLGTNYSVTVSARRVNVNAVTQHPDAIVQDFALVVSVGDGIVTNAFTITSQGSSSVAPPQFSMVTNGVPRLHERVGANSPLLAGTNGTPSQWNFYVFTNSFMATNSVSLTNGTNVAFITFLPPNVSRPRNVDADVDLYVSRGGTLTDFLNLNFGPGTVRSTKRGGTEVVFFTNSFDGEVFYVGVKSEDQQGGEYGFTGLSSNVPFSGEENGNLIVQGFPFSAQVADGSAEQPGGILIFGIATRPIQIQKVIANLGITHESIGDLLGNLSHDGEFVVLNNHYLPPNGQTSGPFGRTYDDSADAGPGTFPSDGPGSLNNFLGQDGSGLWLLTMVDNALTGTGRVDNFDITLVPQPDPNNIVGSVLPNRFIYYFIDVPVDATNLTATLSSMTPSAPLDLYIRRGDVPDANNFDKFARINPPGGQLTITPNDIPPLNAGRYFVGVFNPNTFIVNFHLRLSFGRGPKADSTGVFSAGIPVILPDDAVSQSTINVPLDRIIADVKVGVRIEHPRVSDLALHLTSPQGTRILLAEDRGGTNAGDYGLGSRASGISYAGFTEDTSLFTGPIKFASPPFSTNAPATTTFVSGFEGVPAGVLTAGKTVDGWTVITNQVSVVTTNIADTGTNVLDLLRGRISRVLPTALGKQYSFRFAFRSDFAAPASSGGKTFIDPRLLLTRTNLCLVWDSVIGANYYVEAKVELSDPDWTVISRTNTATSTNMTFCLDLPTVYRFFQVVQLAPAGSSGINVVAVSPNGPSEKTFIEPKLLLTSTNLCLVWDSVIGANYYVEAKVQLSDTNWTVISPTNAATSTNVTFCIDRPTIYRFFQVVQLGPGGLAGNNEIQVFVDGALQQTYTSSNSVWQIASTAFTAISAGTTVEIAAGTNSSGMFLDSFELTESGGTIYYQPEESLDLLKGERSIGDWNLEVWDNRSQSAGRLLNWQLQLTFANPTKTAVTLTNGLCYTNVIAGDGIQYFIVEVPRAATIATNTLTGAGDLVLLFNQTGAPTGGTNDLIVNVNGVGGGEFMLLSTNGTQLLDTAGAVGSDLITPVLLPGQRYYLAVLNFNSGETNDFTLCVNFDRIDEKVIVLTNKIAFTNTIQVTSKIDYYKFTVSPTAYKATFEVFPQNGNVDLVIHKDFPLPTQTLFDFNSTNLGTNAEQIVVTSTNRPIGLVPGDWYLGVYNVDTNQVTYSVVVTELTNAVNLIRLTNNVPLDYSASTDPVITNYFVFTLTNTDPGALFELFNVTGDADLLLQWNQLPTVSSSFRITYASTNFPGSGKIIIRTNDAFYPTLQGEWYLAVVNKTTNDINFTIRASVLTTNLVITPLTNGIAFANTVPGNNDGSPPEIDYYRFTVSPNALYADFDLLPVNGNVDLVLRKGALPSPTLFDYNSNNLQLTNEFIRVLSNSVPVALTPGDWFLGVDNRQRGNAAVTYSVRASEFLTGFPGTNVFINPTLLITSSNICLTWPSVAGRQYYVEGKVGVADPSWTVLSPTNTAAGTTMSFCIDRPTPYRFFQVVEIGAVPPPLPPSTTNVFINPTLTITSSNICLTWPSVAGRQYYVEGKVGVADPSWTVLSPTNTAAGTTMSFCIDRPTPYQFFQVVELGTIPPPQPPSTTNVFINPTLTITSSNICLTWPSVAGRQYYAEGKVGIADPSWTVLSPTNTAAGTTMSFCIDRPTPYQFFQVVELGTVPPPPSTTNVFITPTLTVTSSNICLTWDSIVGRNYFVEGKAGIADPGWTVLSPTNTATGTTMSFCIDRPTPYQFFQVVEVAAGTPTPPPSSTNVYINPTLSITASNLCLTWPSVAGRSYYVDGKIAIGNPGWIILSPTNVATGPTMSFCIDLPTPYQFFQVVELGTPATAPVELLINSGDLVLTTNGFRLSWAALSNERFEVQYATNLPPVWLTFTNIITSTNGNFTFVDASVKAGGPIGFRIYRLIPAP